MNGSLVIIIILFVFTPLFSLWSYFYCKNKAIKYINTRMGEIISINWYPFGPGWFGERDSFIYKLVYEDSNGDQHQAFCKSGIFSGVYFTEDKIVSKNKKEITEENPDVDVNKKLEKLLKDRIS